MVRAHLKAILAVFVLILICAAVSWGKAKSECSPMKLRSGNLLAIGARVSMTKTRRRARSYLPNTVNSPAFEAPAIMAGPDVEKHYQMVFSTLLKNAHRTDTVRSFQFLSPTIASVDTEFEMTGASAPNSTETTTRPPRKGLLTWIVTKQDGR